MLCKCGKPAQPRSLHCDTCRKAIHAAKVREQRVCGYDPADHVGKRAELQRMAREAGLIR